MGHCDNYAIVEGTGEGRCLMVSRAISGSNPS